MSTFPEYVINVRIYGLWSNVYKVTTTQVLEVRRSKTAHSTRV